MGIASITIAHNLSIDIGTALHGMFILFKHEYTSTFGYGEAAAAGIERCAGIFQGLSNNTRLRNESRML